MKRITHFLILMLLSVVSAWAVDESQYELVFDGDLTSQDGFDKFSTVNENGYTASYQWKFVTSAARIQHTSSKGNDDWLISPAVALTAGKQYLVVASVRCLYKDRADKYSLNIGTDTDPGHFTSLSGDRECNVTDWEEIEAEYTPSASGDVRVALHAFSTEKANTFYVRYIKVYAQKSAAVPAAVSNLKVIPDATGELSAEIQFTAPSTTQEGAPLSAITKIEIYRALSDKPTAAQTLVETIDNPTPGSEQKIETTVIRSTAYYYTVVAYNEEGSGGKTGAGAFIGEDFPKAPATVTLREEGDNLVITWDAVTEGGTGLYVNPDNITYEIVDAITKKPLINNLTTTTYTLEQKANEGALQEHQYTVTPWSKNGGSGYSATSGKLISNEPAVIPLTESFTGSGSYAWNLDNWWQTTKASTSSYWQKVTNNYDGDNSGLEFIPWKSNEVMEFNTLKISLKDAKDPKLVFAHGGFPGSKHKISVLIDKKPQGVAESVYSYDYETQDYSEEVVWTQAIVDLKPYVSEDYVIVKFVVESKTSGDAIVIDDIRIFDAPALDVEVKANIPENIKVDEEKTIQATVRSLGTYYLFGFSVDCYVNGELVKSYADQSLAPFASKNYEFPITATITDSEQLEVEVKVNFKDDADPSNNTVTASVEVEQSTLPKATDLVAVLEDTKVNLSWTAPAGGTYQVTEDFESQTPFSLTDLSPWTTVDKDGEATLYLDEYSVPGISYPNTETPKAFMVFNPQEAKADVSSFTALAPYSGSQYAIAFNPQSYYVSADDWLISPLLPGNAQTISFYVKAVDVYWGVETLEVYSSSEGNSVDNFTTQVGETTEVNDADNWKKLTFDLPEGTKYFAIRCTSFYNYALMIDDITYEQEAPTPTGYAIYRDGEQVATVTALETSWTDETAEEGKDYTYHVAALYEQGASALSEPAEASIPSGIREVNTQQADRKIFTLDGRRVQNATTKGVYIINGRKVVK